MLYYLKKEWKWNLLTAVFTIAVSLCEVLTSLVMMQTTENIIHFCLEGFLAWMLIDLGLFVMMFSLDQIGTVYKGKAIRRMNNRLRLDMAASLARMNHQQYHGQGSGEYLSQLTNDVNQVENLVWENFYQCISIVASVVFSLVALVSLHWSLAFFAVLAAIVMLNVPKLFGSKMETLGTECTQKQAQGTANMKDLVSGLEVLRSFGRIDRYMEGMGAASDQVEQPKYRLMWMKNLAQNGIGMLSILVQVMLNFVIGFLSIRGVIIQSALMGGGNLCGAVSNGLGSWGRFQLAFSAAKPYFEKITVRAEDLKYPAEEERRIVDTITLENVSFGYGEKQVLDRESFCFEKGGKYALTGPSGCGKSTVLKLILGWLPDYRGSICFDGRDAREFSPEQIQQQMSYIEQDVFLFNTTIRDNITLGEELLGDALEKAVQDSALAGDLANMPLGLDTPVGEDGSNLSGGQKQRVAIARALIHNRSILLVDEGTSALDQKNADIVEKSLLENPELTLILVSHHLTPQRKAQFTKVFELRNTKQEVTQPV